MPRTPRTPDATISTIHAEQQFRPQGFVMPRHHSHPYFELFYVEKGSAHIVTDNDIYDLSPGDFLLIPPHEFHYTNYHSSDCKRSTVFFRDSDISPQLIAKMPGNESFFQHIRIFQVPNAYQPQVSEIIRQMATEERIDDEYAPFILQSMFNALMFLCRRHCMFYQDIPDNIHTTDRQLVTAARYISEHYMEQITTKDVANASGFSPNYLTRKFREATGLGIRQYLIFIRLQHAASELLSTRDSITQIAFRCGFTDSNYFKDVFKKNYGMSPSSYRNES